MILSNTLADALKSTGYSPVVDNGVQVLLKLLAPLAPGISDGEHPPHPQKRE